MHYALSRSAFLDVKWAQIHKINESFSVQQHYNPYFELIAVTEGPVYLQAGDEKVVLHTGDTFLLGPWEPHKGWKSEANAGEFYWVQFAASPALQPFDFAQDEGKGKSRGLGGPYGPSELRTGPSLQDETMIVPRHFCSSGRFQLLSQFEQLVKEMESAKGYYRYRVSLLLGSMLERLASDMLEHVRPEVSLPASYVTYRSTVSYIDNNYQRPLTSDSFERVLDRKYEYLCGVFKKYAGITIGSYIQHLRIQRAKYLLHASNQPIQAIAAEVGIDDPFHFSKLFKKLVGSSPTEYRGRERQS